MGTVSIDLMEARRQKSYYQHSTCHAVNLIKLRLIIVSIAHSYNPYDLKMYQITKNYNLEPIMCCLIQL